MSQNLDIYKCNIVHLSISLCNEKCSEFHCCCGKIPIQLPEANARYQGFIVDHSTLSYKGYIYNK